MTRYFYPRLINTRRLRQVLQAELDQATRSTPIADVLHDLEAVPSRRLHLVVTTSVDDTLDKVQAEIEVSSSASGSTEHPVQVAVTMPVSTWRALPLVAELRSAAAS